MNYCKKHKRHWICEANSLNMQAGCDFYESQGKYHFCVHVHKGSQCANPAARADAQQKNASRDLQT